jgi:hypothetical protein
MLTVVVVVMVVALLKTESHLRVSYIKLKPQENRSELEFPEYTRIPAADSKCRCGPMYQLH